MSQREGLRARLALLGHFKLEPGEEERTVFSANSLCRYSIMRMTRERGEATG